ncbi:hypothetical protein HBA54_09370 [Pelagibius litoralis]|uniref:Alpha/beta hydrolase family protein n=1 Tax=Pelagibius litoralis TaxID=374515 RepID=A0A967C4R6_9PROT|nr:hypothetical protein [Pelagibius litoralis]NIA68800.1 hypothetical protein [Pelagibius litoralis]
MTERDSHLPAPRRNPLDWNPLGDLVMRPWYDRWALGLVARWYLPLSRAWAAGLAHAGDKAAFAEAAGLEGFPGGLTGRAIRRAIAKNQRRLGDYLAADARWLEAYFAAAAPLDEVLVDRERARLAAASALMAARAGFMPIRRRVAQVRWQMTPPGDFAPPEDWLGSAGTCITQPSGAGPDSPLPPVEVSHPVPGPLGPERWLRFASPGLPGDTAWARVFEPEGVENPPSFINLHGIGMELDFWSGAVDSTASLLRRGLRVIRPEGPWHGRRRIAGCYGGEPAMALGPEGFLKLFSTWGAEAGVMTAWARQNGSRRVAIGGVSLGALTSQLTAVAASEWPEITRPDALLLVATSANSLDVAMAGSLSRAVGYPAALAQAGWSPEDLARYAPLLEPRGAPAMPPERIVMTLGEADTVTPFDGGLALARRWGVPPENLFIRRQGHFSVSLDLNRQPQPLNRIAAILNGD